MKKGDRVRNKFDASKGLGTVRDVSDDGQVITVLWDKYRIDGVPLENLVHAFVPPSRWFKSDLKLED